MEVDTARPKTRFCTDCGEALAANARFCAACGAKVAAAPADASVATIATPLATAPGLTCPYCGEPKAVPRAGCSKCGNIDMKLMNKVQSAPRATPVRLSPDRNPASQHAGGQVPKPLIWFSVIAALLIAIAIFSSLSSADDGDGLPTALPAAFPTARPTVRTSTPVTYTVTGTNGVTRAGLTYQNAQGGTEQAEVTLPWTTSFTARPGSFVYLSAQNYSNIAGGISCGITANGQSFKRSNSSGVAVIASCSGSAP